ncbi:MAG: hypothetical protein J5I98_31255 [Phaeodactylibacter sp.]|nr:hypothetical protein [Phaeodactylibacter sp.]
MKKLIKPASLLLCLLALLVFFVAATAGASYAGMAEGQGLAGSAIVLGYGVAAGLGAVVAALFFAFYASHRAVVVANWGLAGVLLVVVIILGC